jgi:hypothetical protein
MWHSEPHDPESRIYILLETPDPDTYVINKDPQLCFDLILVKRTSLHKIQHFYDRTARTEFLIM